MTARTQPHPAARRPPCGYRKRVLTVATLVTVALTGCAPSANTRSGDAGAAGDGLEGAQVVPAPDGVPITVPGTAACATLSDPKATGPKAATPAADSGEAEIADLTLPCLTAPGHVRLPELNGALTLVNLWASWCAPCREEMPALQAASVRYAGQVRFLGVDTMDSPEAAAAFLREVDVTYPEVTDPDGLLLDELRIPGLPVTLVLDGRGRVAQKHVGPLTEDQIDDLLEPLL